MRFSRRVRDFQHDIALRTPRYCVAILALSNSRLFQCFYRLQVRFRHGCFAKIGMTLSTNKAGILFFLIDLVIENPPIAGSRRHVATFRAATRAHRNRVRRHCLMALRAFHICVNFMPKRACGASTPPACRRKPILNPDRAQQLFIKIRSAFFRRARFVTRITA